MEMSENRKCKRWKWATYRDEYWCGAYLEITLLSLHQTRKKKNNIDLLFPRSKKYQENQIVKLVLGMPDFFVIKNSAVSNRIKSWSPVIWIHYFRNGDTGIQCCSKEKSLCDCSFYFTVSMTLKSSVLYVEFVVFWTEGEAWSTGRNTCNDTSWRSWGLNTHSSKVVLNIFSKWKFQKTYRLNQ